MNIIESRKSYKQRKEKANMKNEEWRRINVKQVRQCPKCQQTKKNCYNKQKPRNTLIVK